MPELNTWYTRVYTDRNISVNSSIHMRHRIISISTRQFEQRCLAQGARGGQVATDAILLLQALLCAPAPPENPPAGNARTAAKTSSPARMKPLPQANSLPLMFLLLSTNVHYADVQLTWLKGFALHICFCHSVMSRSCALHVAGREGSERGQGE